MEAAAPSARRDAGHRLDGSAAQYWLGPDEAVSFHQALPGLCAALERTLDATATQIDGLLAAMLPPPRVARRSHSALNGDGCPLQLCVTLRASGAHTRLLVDPTPFEASPVPRRTAALEVVQRVLRGWGSDALAELGMALGQQLAPAGLAEAPEFGQGIAWVARGLGASGAAVYFPTDARDPAAGWSRLAGVDGLGESRRPLEALQRAVTPHGVLASVGLEGSDARDARLKLYWRMRTAVTLEAAGFGAPLPAAVTRALRGLMGDFDLPTTGMVLGRGYAVHDGASRDAKIDLCACPRCLKRTHAQWRETLAAACDALQLDGHALAPLWSDARLEVALVGLGFEGQGDVRLNVYFKECIR